MNKKIISILIILSMVVAISACGKKEVQPVSEADTAINVSVAEVISDSIYSAVNYTGDIKASTTASVSPKVSGIVKSICVKEGDYVKAGSVLMYIDNESYQLAYNQANAALTGANAALSNANAAYESAVAGKESASAGEDSAIANEASAVAGESSAQAAYDNAVAGYNSAVAAYNSVKEGSIEQNKIAMDQNTTTAKTAYDNATDNYNRQKALFDIGAISQVELDSAKTAMDNAKVAYDSAVANANINSTVVAPQSEASAQAKVDQAKAAVEQAKSAVEQAKSMVAQAKAGVTKAKSATSQAAAAEKQALAGIEQANGSIAQAKAALDVAKANLDNCTVVSPIAGYVSAKNVQIGQTASQGMEAFAIKNADAFEVEINVTEAVIAKISVGSPAYVSVDAAGIDNLAASVITAGETKNEKTGLFVVKVSLPNKDKNLKAGMIADVKLTTDSAEAATIVPVDAVMQDGDESYVYVANGNIAEKRLVTVGVTNDNSVQITDGLAAGESVVTEGKEFLSETNNKINVVAE